jgi:hypothetical protein
MPTTKQMMRLRVEAHLAGVPFTHDGAVEGNADMSMVAAMDNRKTRKRLAGLPPVPPNSSVEGKRRAVRRLRDKIKTKKTVVVVPDPAQAPPQCVSGKTLYWLALTIKRLEVQKAAHDHIKSLNRA